MTKSLNYLGFVAGFWNGLCGGEQACTSALGMSGSFTFTPFHAVEVDKSKPPVGALALSLHLKRYPDDLWLADLLLDQFVSWSKWWASARQFSIGTGGKTGAKNITQGLLAPGSTRQNMQLPISCVKQVQLKGKTRRDGGC